MGVCCRFSMRFSFYFERGSLLIHRISCGLVREGNICALLDYSISAYQDNVTVAQLSRAAVGVLRMGFPRFCRRL